MFFLKSRFPVGSYLKKNKIKKLYHFLIQKGRTGLEKQSDQSKPKISSENSKCCKWVSGVWDSVVICWAPPGLGSLTSSPAIRLLAPQN